MAVREEQTQWNDGKHDSSKASYYHHKRAISPMIPQEDLNLMLDNYLDPRVRHRSTNLNYVASMSDASGYSYSVPHGSPMNSYSYNQYSSTQETTTITSLQQSSPSQNSVDSGYSGGSSPFQFNANQQRQCSQAQNCFSNYQTFSSYNSFDVPKCEESSNSPPVSNDELLNSYSWQETSTRPQGFEEENASTTPISIDTCARNGLSVTEPSSGEVSNCAQFSYNCSQPDQDLSSIVDQVLDSIDAQFSNEPLPQQEYVSSLQTLESNVLCHFCAHVVSKGTDVCGNCGTELKNSPEQSLDISTEEASHR